MEPRWLSDTEQEAWRHLVAVLLRLPGALEQQLQRDAGLAHIEYLVLAVLSETEEQRAQLSHLAAQANASLSRLSHVVTRLERRGWVRRERDADDARVTHAVLTEAGRAVVVAAAPAHATHVRRLVFDGLTPAHVDALRDVSGHILAQLDPPAGPVGTPRSATADATTRDARAEVSIVGAEATADRARTTEADPEGEGDSRQGAVDARPRAPVGSSSRPSAQATRVAHPVGGGGADPEVEVEGGGQLVLDVLGAVVPGPSGALSAPQSADGDVEEVEVTRASWAAEVATHRVIRGQRWRTSDPRIPEPLRQRLVDELMDARRAVRDAPDADHERAARDRVHDAKVALGERGLRWWEADLDASEVAERTRATARALVATRDADDGAGSLVEEVAAAVSRPPDEVRAHLDGGDAAGLNG